MPDTSCASIGADIGSAKKPNPKPTTAAGSEAQISDLLARARRLNAHLATTQAAVHPTWRGLCEIVAATERLGELTRHPELERVYSQEFNPAIRREFGSVERYLKAKLDFATTNDDASPQEPSWTCPPFEMVDGGRDAGGERGSQFRVRLNDWGYSIPRHVEHYVVWVNRPLFHPSLCCPPDSRCREPSHSWDFVQSNGLSGLTGAASIDRLARRMRAEEPPVRSAPSRDETQRGSEENDAGPRREIERFVESRWPVKDGYATAWFANPPRLQSVPGLAHFHVLMVRIEDEAAAQVREDAELDAEGNRGD